MGWPSFTWRARAARQTCKIGAQRVWNTGTQPRYWATRVRGSWKGNAHKCFWRLVQICPSAKQKKSERSVCFTKVIRTVWRTVVRLTCHIGNETRKSSSFTRSTPWFWKKDKKASIDSSTKQTTRTATTATGRKKEEGRWKMEEGRRRRSQSGEAPF